MSLLSESLRAFAKCFKLTRRVLLTHVADYNIGKDTGFLGGGGKKIFVRSVTVVKEIIITAQSAPSGISEDKVII